LALTAAINLFILVGNISLSTFQSGIGKTVQIMKQSALSLVTLPAAYLIVYLFYNLGSSNPEAAASYAVVGGALAIILASMPGMIWGLVWSYKNYGVKADFGISAKIFVASILASVVAYLTISVLSLPYWMLLVAGFSVFLVVYLALTPLLGAVNSMDIENFRNMLAGLGIFSKLLNLPFRFMGKLCRANPNHQSDKEQPETPAAPTKL